MPRRIVLTVTMMTELEAILISREGKPVTIAENVETLTSFTYLFWNLMVWLWKFFLPFSFFIPYLNMFSVAFTWTFEFIPPTSILEPAITPTFKQYYPPSILTKHPMWYSLNADFFISIWGILYGLHWRYFQNSPLFQEIVAHGEKQLVRLLPFDILKNDLFDHFLILLYHGSFKLNHLTRDDWIDLKQLCVDWYFPGQTAIIIQKFCDLRHCQLPPMQRLLVMSIPTQQIIRWSNWEEKRWQKVHLVQIEESDEESCVEDNSTWIGGNVTFLPYFTFTPPFLHHNYLISLLQGHMVIHTPPLWLISILIFDSFIPYLWLD